MCVILKVQKQLQAGAYRLMQKLHKIVRMNIIIIDLSCNFFKCPAKMSLVSCIHFYSGWHVCKWGEGRVFDFSYSLFVCTLLDCFMFSIACGYADLSVGGGVGIEDTNIKVSTLVPAAPKAIGGNIQACAIQRI